MIAKALKWAGLFLATLLTFVGGFLVNAQIAGIPSYPHGAPARHVEVTPERVAAGSQLAMTLCTGCHLDPTTKRLTGKRLRSHATGRCSATRWSRSPRSTKGKPPRSTPI
jgi:hypothetical protein